MAYVVTAVWTAKPGQEDIVSEAIAALVGAGGLGDPILQGITLRSSSLILAGAVPCAVLALAVQAFFALLERVLVPRGLRVRTHVG